jgi:Zn-dependent protease
MNKLTGAALRLFQFRGITVYLHWSWLLVAYYEIAHGVTPYSSRLWNAAEYLTLFALVLLHEFGHALACRSVGGAAERIMLWPLGGVAYVRPPARPGALLWSIAAGPLVNLLLVPVTVGLAVLLGIQGWHPNADLSDLNRFLLSVAAMNLVLLVFNILPIYPLDGGQMLYALLWFVLGSARSLMVVSVIGLVGVAALAGLALLSHSTLLFILAAYLGWRAFSGFGLGMRMGSLQRGRDLLNQGLSLRKQGRSAEAIDLYTEALDLLESDPHALSLGYQLRATARSKSGDYAAAKADYMEAVRVDPNSPTGLNDFAWLLATCPRAEFRDGATAVTLASQACELTHWQKPSCLGTLGAAYAETGRMQEAIDLQNRALQSSEYQRLHGDKAKERLDLYAAGKPFHEDEVGISPLRLFEQLHNQEAVCQPVH